MIETLSDRETCQLFHLSLKITKNISQNIPTKTSTKQCNFNTIEDIWFNWTCKNEETKQNNKSFLRKTNKRTIFEKLVVYLVFVDKIYIYLIDLQDMNKFNDFEDDINSKIWFKFI